MRAAAARPSTSMAGHRSGCARAKQREGVARVEPDQSGRSTGRPAPRAGGPSPPSTGRGRRPGRPSTGWRATCCREGQRPVVGRGRVDGGRVPGRREGGQRVGPGHLVEPGPEPGDLGPALGHRLDLRLPPRRSRSWRTADRLPKAVADLDRLEERPRTPVGHIGHGAGLFRLPLPRTRAGVGSSGSVGVPTAWPHRRSPRTAPRRRRRWRTGLVDQPLLGDAELGELRPGRPRPHPLRHQPGGVGVRP